jgi:predicted amidohydrolase YtcJ
MLCADLIFVNGHVWTVTRGRADAVAVRDGKIVAVGRNEEVEKLKGQPTQTIDLKGQTLLPGFIDAHTHFISTGLEETLFLEVTNIRSLAETLEKLRERAQTLPEGAWLRARGWDESLWPEQQYITKRDLDRVAPDHPAIAIRVDGHLLCANSQALNTVKNFKIRPGEFDEVSGLLREETAWSFLDQIQPTHEQFQEAILTATQKAYGLGVTSLHDIVRPSHVKAYMALHQTKKLKIRIYFNPEIKYLDELERAGLRTGLGDRWLRLGAIKFFADGSIGARNAALHQPYRDAPGTTGKLNYEPSELNHLVKRSHEAGFQVMIHAIGDRAIDAALDAYADVGVSPERRHRIEHVELATASHLKRMNQMGILASMQPNFVQWSGKGGLYETRLGPDRDAQIDPHRAVLNLGVRLVFSSDRMPFSPLYGIHSAVNAPFESQRISVEEAIRSYTIEGAYASFEEKEKGSIEVGKLADLVVLGEDPTKNSKKIEQLSVKMTFLEGQRVY